MNISISWNAERICNRSDRNLLTQQEKYFFSKKAPFVAKYSDITWMYPHRVRTNGIVTNKSVVVNTRACSDMNWQVKDLEGSYEKIAEGVRQVNPEVMLGYTEENKQMYQNTL